MASRTNFEILAATLDVTERFINPRIEYFNLQKTTWGGLKLFFDPFSIKRDESQRSIISSNTLDSNMHVGDRTTIKDSKHFVHVVCASVLT